MDKITATKKVRNSGHSLVLFVTEECKMIDVDRGDIVEVTIKKVEDGEEQLTEDQIKDLMCDTRFASH